MPGAVPYTSLAFPSGGVDGLGNILASMLSYTSPLLMSGLMSSTINTTNVKRGEQFAMSVRASAGTGLFSQNDASAAGQQLVIDKTIHSTPMQIRATANLSSNAMASYGHFYLTGMQGDMYSASSSFLQPTEKLLHNSFLTDIKSQAHAVAQGVDEMLFKSIFSNNYINTSAPTNSAMTNITSTFSSAVTIPPVSLAVNLVTATDSQLTGIKLLNNIKQAYRAVDANGEGPSQNNAPAFLLVPDFIFDAFMPFLQTISLTPLRYGSGMSDNSYQYHNVSVATTSGITIVGLPRTWFYTVSGDLNNSYFCLLLTQDAMGYYVPKQSTSIVPWVNNLLSFPGFQSDVKGVNVSVLNQAILNQAILDNESAGPNTAISPEIVAELAAKYNDPTLATMLSSVASRFPNLASGIRSQHFYDPMSFGLICSQQPVTSDITNSLSLVFWTYAMASTVRALPQHIVPFYINPALVTAAPPVYSNPYTATTAAMMGIKTDPSNAVHKRDFAAYVKTFPKTLDADLLADVKIGQYLTSNYGAAWRADLTNLINPFTPSSDDIAVASIRTFTP